MAATTSAFEAELLVTATTLADPTNLVTNPSVEANATGYVATGTPGATALQSADFARSGSSSIKLTQGSGAGTLDLTTVPGLRFPATPGRAYSLAVALRPGGTPRTATVILDWYDAGGVRITNVGQAVTEIAGQWVTGAVENKIAPAGTVTAMVFVRVNAVAAAEVHYIDSIIAVEGASAPAYFDGDTRGYGWTGTAHASASRAAFANYTIEAKQRGLMAGPAYKLRQLYLNGIADPQAHTLAKNHPKQVKALTDNGKLASFDAITAP